MITAAELLAISQESAMGYYLLPELCEATGHAFPLVVPAPDTSVRDALPDPFLTH